ncbi:hypothetical protein PR048_029994 [Dryococelus australis]|uniref:Uncharacterized protein n=1 Tax=Dryococelus australis TaxID=614101 RepID=A0ABQ9GAD0_9NEOP|nr:hypothetical protein PR048_029994 [Dryococelus australis]
MSLLYTLWLLSLFWSKPYSRTSVTGAKAASALITKHNSVPLIPPVESFPTPSEAQLHCDEVGEEAWRAALLIVAQHPANVYVVAVRNQVDEHVHHSWTTGNINDVQQTLHVLRVGQFFKRSIQPPSGPQYDPVQNPLITRSIMFELTTHMLMFETTDYAFTKSTTVVLGSAELCPVRGSCSAHCTALEIYQRPMHICRAVLGNDVVLLHILPLRCESCEAKTRSRTRGFSRRSWPHVLPSVVWLPLCSDRVLDRQNVRQTFVADIPSNSHIILRLPSPLHLSTGWTAVAGPLPLQPPAERKKKSPLPLRNAVSSPRWHLPPSLLQSRNNNNSSDTLDQVKGEPRRMLVPLYTTPASPSLPQCSEIASRRLEASLKPLRHVTAVSPAPIFPYLCNPQPQSYPSNITSIVAEHHVTVGSSSVRYAVNGWCCVSNALRSSPISKNAPAARGLPGDARGPATRGDVRVEKAELRQERQGPSILLEPRSLETANHDAACSQAHACRLCKLLADSMKRLLELFLLKKIPTLNCRNQDAEFSFRDEVQVSPEFSVTTVQWLDCSPPTEADQILRVRIVPDDTANWRGGGFGDLPFSPPLHYGAAPYSSQFTLIGSRDLDVKSHPNLPTPLSTLVTISTLVIGPRSSTPCLRNGVPIEAGTRTHLLLEVSEWDGRRAFKVKKRGSDTGDTNTHAYRLIGPTRKARTPYVVPTCRNSPTGSRICRRAACETRGSQLKARLAASHRTYRRKPEATSPRRPCDARATSQSSTAFLGDCVGRSSLPSGRRC